MRVDIDREARVVRVSQPTTTAAPPTWEFAIWCALLFVALVAVLQEDKAAVQAREPVAASVVSARATYVESSAGERERAQGLLDQRNAERMLAR